MVGKSEDAKGGDFSSSDNTNAPGTSQEKTKKKNSNEDGGTQKKIDNFVQSVFDLIALCKKLVQEDGNSDLAEIKKTLELNVPLLNACKTSINVILKETPQDRLNQSPAKKKKTSPTLHKEIKNQDPIALVTKDVIEAFSKAAKDIDVWFSVIGLDPNPSDKDVTRLKLLKCAFNVFCPKLDAVLDAISKRLKPNTGFSPLY